MRSTFPKEEKLKHQKQIQEVFAKGSSVTVFPLKLLYLKWERGDSNFKAGFSVPKRNFKSAVERNRLKRLLREAYRLNKHGIFNKTEGNYALMFLYLGKELPSFPDVERNMRSVLSKFLSREANEKADS
ncbi:ribonuclease P protein component [Muriicola soli]|uniref:Ribonuclease P protein component n=1 Tax=Muriicola soli TaxID=2507538 RepID=A0A411EDF8_9FLAO|nr:ribonuclease P protein component [Muriicola soli]QBA65673.1 ribonuclease P protein component [Muriicola soli]